MTSTSNQSLQTVHISFFQHCTCCIGIGRVRISLDTVKYINIRICNSCLQGYVSFVIITILSFPLSWLITGNVTRVTQRVLPVEQELFTLPGHLSSHPVFSGVCCTRSIVFLCSILYIIVCFSFSFIQSMPVIRYTAPDYPFSIFKLFVPEPWQGKDELVSDRNSSTFVISGLNINKRNIIPKGIHKWTLQWNW